MIEALWTILLLSQVVLSGKVSTSGNTAIGTPSAPSPDITSTQAILRYTASGPDQCQVEVSTSPTYSPLVPAVDPTLFTGANMDGQTNFVSTTKKPPPSDKYSYLTDITVINKTLKATKLDWQLSSSLSSYSELDIVPPMGNAIIHVFVPQDSVKGRSNLTVLFDYKKVGNVSMNWSKTDKQLIAKVQPDRRFFEDRK